MNPTRLRWPTLVCVVAATAFSSGCVATGGGYDGTVGYDADYYEPYGYDYGGWGVGYGVGPYRDHDHRGGGHGGHHAFRSAPSSRSVPSIPSGSRGGQGGGGGHGGGGGGRR